MKIPPITCLLISLPVLCLAAGDDGDWEFLKSRLPDKKTMETFARSKREWTDTFRFTPAALKFIEGAERISVFEGMPHQNFESELLKNERDKIEETMIGGFPFYPLHQDLREKDEPPLRKLLLNDHSLSPFLYLKMCGGFHPDYAIRFTKGGEHCDILLCFGCGDGMILHHGKVIHCHIHGGWEDLLAGYAKHRPKPER
jgi:hypothetical protein